MVVVEAVVVIVVVVAAVVPSSCSTSSSSNSSSGSSSSSNVASNLASVDHPSRTHIHKTDQITITSRQRQQMSIMATQLNTCNIMYNKSISNIQHESALASGIDTIRFWPQGGSLNTWQFISDNICLSNLHGDEQFLCTVSCTGTKFLSDNRPKLSHLASTM